MTFGLEACPPPAQPTQDAWVREAEYDLLTQLRWVENLFVTAESLPFAAARMKAIIATSASPHLVVFEPSICQEKSGSELLFELRRLSGLTWDQIAQICNVSRRSVHLWAAGKVISSANHQRLGDLVATLRFIDRGYRDLNRDLLLSSSGNQNTFLELLSIGDFETVKRLAGEGKGRPEHFTPSAGSDNYRSWHNFGEVLAASTLDSEEVILDDQPQRRLVKARRRE